MTNQLRALLEAHWPGATRLFKNIEAGISLASLDRFPTSQAAAQLRPSKLDAFLRRHAYTGGKTGAELLQRLRNAPKAASKVSPEIVTVMVNTQAGQVCAIVEALQSLESAIDQVLDTHPYAKLFQPLPRVGAVNVAQIIG